MKAPQSELFSKLMQDPIAAEALRGVLCNLPKAGQVRVIKDSTGTCYIVQRGLKKIYEN